MITHIRKGVEARRQHDPIELAKDYDRVAHEPLEAGGIISGSQGRGAVYTPPPPERLTVLEDEIVEIICSNTCRDGSTVLRPDRVARRILKIRRIAKALRLLDDHESGLCDIVYPGSGDTNAK